MPGRVLTPRKWYNKKLQHCPSLNNDQSKLNTLKDFIDFLEQNELYMSVIGEGRDTKNSSIYTENSTDKANWLCDIKLFDGNMFDDSIEIVGKEQMNTVGDIYENQKFSKVLEILSGEAMGLGRYSTIKMKININGFNNALEIVKKAISIYKVFNYGKE